MDSHTEICKYIQNNISKLCQTEIDEVFKILHKNNSTYTQNNNGVFVNLNWINENILNQIKDYIIFCLRSQTEINKYEIMKSMIEDSMVNKHKQEDDDKNNNDINTSNTVNTCTKVSRVSSSMKFYLLKKKFQKKTIIQKNNNNNINNILTHEEYVYI
jgi:hypothetical protein